MFQRLIDDIKDSTGFAVRMTTIAIAAVVALFITTAFICAAAFIAVLNKYGAMYACLAGAAVYGMLTFIAAGIYMYRKSQAKKLPLPVEKTKSAIQTALADPVLLATGLQIVRTIGIKRLIPILAVGGIALGVMATRGTGTTTTDGDD